MKSAEPRQATRGTRSALTRRIVAALALPVACSGSALAETLPSNCGTLTASFGPFDYRPERYIPENTYRSHGALLRIVEQAHFTPEVEMLIRGKTGTLPGGDLSYTLGVFPNHHRALVAVSKLAIRERALQPRETRYSVDCYFQRAMAFRPDDMMVRMIYANYLTQVQRVRDAEAQLDAVASQNPESPITQRNLSLLFLDVKNYEKALVHAHKAASLGLNIDLLKEKLQQAGRWSDSPPPPQDSAPDAATTAASAPSK